MKQKTFLSRKNLDILNRIVLIDGFSGTGKGLLGDILSHLPKAEQWQIDYFYEQIAILNYIHKLPVQSLKALCELRSNEAIYNLYIGRNVNFRATDKASPVYNGLKKKYQERLKKEEKIPALNEILKSDPTLILNIHYLFGYSKVLIDIFWKNLKLYILMLRDPFYLIDYWYSGNVSSNRGKNKLDFGLCIEVKKKLLPWYTKEYSQAYLKANNLEKSILTVSELYKRVIFMFDNLKSKEKKKMQIIFFEDYLNQPNDYIDLICNKISCKRDKKFNKRFKKIILKSKKINKKTIDFNIFQKKYSEKISPKYKKILIDLNTLYNKFYLNNKII
jgi:hypothetical protein